MPVSPGVCTIFKWKRTNCFYYIKITFNLNPKQFTENDVSVLCIAKLKKILWYHVYWSDLLYLTLSPNRIIAVKQFCKPMNFFTSTSSVFKSLLSKDTLTPGPVASSCWGKIVSPPFSSAGLHLHFSSLTGPEHVCILTEHYRAHPVLNSQFFHLVPTLLISHLVCTIWEIVAEFSTALYPDASVQANTVYSQINVTMSKSCANAPYKRPPFPAVPGPINVPCLGDHTGQNTGHCWSIVLGDGIDHSVWVCPKTSAHQQQG